MACPRTGTHTRASVRLGARATSGRASTVSPEMSRDDDLMCSADGGPPFESNGPACHVLCSGSSWNLGREPAHAAIRARYCACHGCGLAAKIVGQVGEGRKGLTQVRLPAKNESTRLFDLLMRLKNEPCRMCKETGADG